jgi:ribosomal protein L9
MSSDDTQAVELTKSAIAGFEREVARLERQLKEKRKRLRSWKSALQKMTDLPGRRRKPRRPKTAAGGSNV